MTKRNTNQPQPQPSANPAKGETESQNVVAMRGQETASAIRAKERKSILQRKQNEEQRIRQQLAEIADLQAAGAENAQEVAEKKANLATEMFFDIRDGIFQLNQVSGMLGDVFGYRKKGDAKVRVSPGDKNASATPFGEGEAIRKRVVRAVQAHDYVENDVSTALFADAKPDDVRDILNRIGADEDGLSIWSAYDAFGKLKQRNNERPAAAFDPKKVAALTDALSENVERAAEIFADNATLCDAYAELRDVVLEIDRAAGALLQKRKAA